MTGRSHRAYRKEFPVNDSEYADDTAILFNSREDLEEEVPRIISHLARLGIEIHSGLISGDSKSEIDR